MERPTASRVEEPRTVEVEAAEVLGASSERVFERVPVRIHQDARSASRALAEEIAALVRSRAREGRRCVLGLATGSTPTTLYEELVRMHHEEGLSFANVVAFNLDEYFPIDPASHQSYRRFMHEHLFAHVDCPPSQVHIPDGRTPRGKVAAACAAYERAIAEAGGIDLQVLGIGRTGHIGFNEPGSARDSRTRLIVLDRVTRKDAASDFFGEEHVPQRGITMGVGTILDARRIVMLAFGEGKAPIVARAVEGPVTEAVAASFLQRHPDATVLLDQAASAELTRVKTPWRVGPCRWDEALVRKAVVWLAGERKRAVLKLVEEDYNEAGLQDLLASRGGAHEINLEVFRGLQEAITGWPGGKPRDRKRAGDIDRPRDRVFPKRILVFSPHPDDDVISMGGTLIRLVDQGHEVHVAYQTSGSIAVFDADALRFADFAAEYAGIFGVDPGGLARLESEVEKELRAKTPGVPDSASVRRLKGLIRRGEAKSAARACGIPEDRLHFLDLPFYETGTVRKRPIGEADVARTIELLRAVTPHQVYAAGDLSDPHGTHRACLAAVLRAMTRGAPEAWARECEVWLYRGAWQEWEVDRLDMAVPLAPEDVARKRAAIFRHQSQKDRPLFPGADDREFWQRAEDRNRATARQLDALGLPEYEAVEAFVRWDGRSAE
ncbi:MAG: glucosamine-6-phosphate deaminase [Phycisphaerae bacterium]|nr:glucosamine-6-phosphate deaminase [Phycisphaerae bacterium]